VTREQILEQDTHTGADGAGGSAQAERLIPALTIVSHPMSHRVGERLLLDALSAGRPVHLSRGAPDFSSPGKALAMPLADPFLSRKPLTFSASPEEHLRLDPGESGKVSISGEPLRGPREFSPEEVAAGVLVELAKRVVLLLHLAEPTPSGVADRLGMVGTSVGMQRVRRHIERVADLNVPVLIRGETGSGKELIARGSMSSARRRNGSALTSAARVRLTELTACCASSSARGSRS
jgi:two-component system nitrogen regulation response regulator GlnG